jgi:sialidase-1
MVTTSRDRGRTWSPKRPLGEELRGDPKEDPFYDCPRIVTLSDGQLAAITNHITRSSEGGAEQSNWLHFSEDEGETWSEPQETPVFGVVPDQLVELKAEPYAGRRLISAHTEAETESGRQWVVRCWFSEDRGERWGGPHIIAQEPGLLLCEGSILELPGGELVCFMRENSHLGLDCFKSISTDGGETWQGPFKMPIPGCHRPVAGMLQSGKVMITHRYCQGGKGWLGWWTQNFFAALMDVESCLARERNEAHTRIMPIDYDRSPVSDCGYSGWVQFPDGEIYVVSYILDDAPKGQIRGYSLREGDFVAPSPERLWRVGDLSP